MARELAERGHSIVVMGRNHEKLAKTKASLLAEPNVGDVETVCCDLSDVSAANIAHLEASLAPDTRDIGILINNACVSPPYGGAFANHDAADFQVAINIGVIMYVQLTRMVLPGMLKRSRGLIVNVSSCLGRQPTPFMGIYPVVKRFVNAFSEQLSLEFAGKPIDVINLNTGATRTKLYANSATRLPPLTYASPEDYAKTAINAFETRPKELVGSIKQVPGVYIPFLAHRLCLARLFSKLMLDYCGKESPDSFSKKCL